MMGNSPPSATSRPYVDGHAVEEHVVSASYSSRAFYRWPAARRSNHDHDRVPFICASYDHSHMRRLVGSEALLRGEVPPRHDALYEQERNELRAIYRRCWFAGDVVKSAATGIGRTAKQPVPEIAASDLHSGAATFSSIPKQSPETKENRDFGGPLCYCFGMGKQGLFDRCSR